MKVSAIIIAALMVLPAATVSADAINDSQIASIVVIANQVDVDAGTLAAAKSRNAEVKEFAKLMIADHKSVLRAATDLVTKLKVVPQDNPTAQSLKTGGEENLAALQILRGRSFDHAYVEREVAYHQQVIDALDTVLIPGASNADLKALLVKVRPAFVAHLEHAKHLLSTMSKAHR